MSPAIHSGTAVNVGMTGSGGLKVLNSGWQVWSGAGSPSPQRKPLASPASSGHELLPETVVHRGPNFSDNGPQPQTSNAAWEGNDNRPDLLQLQDAHQMQLSLHHPRQRVLPPAAAFSGPRLDDRSTSKSVLFSPQRGADPSAPRVPVSSISAYGGVGGLGHSPGSRPLHLPSIPEDNSLSFRGMAVEDDLAAHSAPQTLATSPRPPVPVPHQPQPQLGPYPQDFPPYYGNPPASDFPFSYDVYGRPPLNPSAMVPPPMTGPAGPSGLFPHAGVPNVGTVSVPPLPQPTVFFDPRSPPAPFHFSSPPVIYPPTPMITAQLPHHMVIDKKNKIQYNLRQQNLIYHPSAVPPQYNPHMSGPVMIGGPLYGPSNVPVYVPQGRQPAANIPSPQPMRRSRLLEELRSNKSKRSSPLDLKDVWGHVVEFSKDQDGSRFIQERIQEASPLDRQRALDEIVPNHAVFLMQDVFGNYVIQKLFEHGTHEQRAMLLAAMEGSIVQLSVHKYGCRVVQKALECLPPDHQMVILREINPYILDCIKNSNGNHVIQKLIQLVPVHRLGFMATLRHHILELGSDSFGCRVLQRCFESLSDEYTRPLLDEVLNHSLTFMQNQYGNYVMQHLIEHVGHQDRARLIVTMRGHLMQLARHKFASHVCEKALRFSDSETRHSLIDVLFKPEEDTHGYVVSSMLKDAYANYVLQAALEVVEGEQKDALFNKVKTQLAGIRKIGANSKQIAAIEKKMMEHSTHKSK